MTNAHRSGYPANLSLEVFGDESRIGLPLASQCLQQLLREESARAAN
jgi:hypothetical protein